MQPGLNEASARLPLRPHPIQRRAESQRAQHAEAGVQNAVHRIGDKPIGRDGVQHHKIYYRAGLDGAVHTEQRA